MSHTFHMQMDVKGALMSWGARSHGTFTHDNGEPYATNAEAHSDLLDLLARGVRYLPMSNDRCDGWTPEKGCPGHQCHAEGSTKP
jgi:hypothetical protein